MNLLKELSIETIRKMPENVTEEDIIYEIRVIAHILEGLKDVKEGRTITTEELLKDVEEWSKKRG